MKEAVLLVLSHFVCDYSLQSDWVAKNKSSVTGDKVMWPWVLFSHAATHAAGVYVVTGSYTAALVELVAHEFIDHWKCNGLFGFVTDQWLHLLTKALILVALKLGWLP